MSLSLRACAALLLPFVLASGNAVAYSQLRCRDGSIRQSCCCTHHEEQAPEGPALSRSCCVVETVQAERTPGFDNRRAPDLSAPAFSFVADLPAAPPADAPLRLFERTSVTDPGPPILLRTCTLLS
ncbi:MAG: hypothetical protein QM765_03825 [Myxococcales bacterium]